MKKRVYSKGETQNPGNISNFDEAKDYLFNTFLDTDKKLFGGETGIHRTRAWMHELNDPQETMPTIHIAGTSGKGSVSYMISSMIEATKSKVGTITSPHVYDVRERLLIDNKYISEDSFVSQTNNIAKAIERFSQADYGRPTYFEVMLGMAYSQFAEEGVDYAVTETGIGGKLDSTNVINRTDKLAVITRLGLDHTEILGSRQSDIAIQKGGIIPKSGHAIILEPEDRESKNILSDIAKENNSTITFINTANHISNVVQSIGGLRFDYESKNRRIPDIELPLLGIYQAENACIALQVIEYICERDDIDVSDKDMKHALGNLTIPARAEVTNIAGHPAIIDGAHNSQKLNSFLDLVDSLDLTIKPLLVFASKRDKNWVSVAQRLAEAADKIYATRFFGNKPGYLSSKSEHPGLIQQHIAYLGASVEPFDNPADALNAALLEAQPNQAIIITGSLYMIGELHDQLVELSANN